jgi:hypothetical protein
MWRGATPCSTKVGQGRQRERRLRDVLVGCRDNAQPEILALRLAGRRPDQHAVSARAVNLLDHEFVQVRKRVREVACAAQDAVGTFASSGFSLR